MKPRAHAHHVDDGVDRADLVEVDALDVDAVDSGLGTGDRLEGPQDGFACRLCEAGRVSDALADLAPMAMGRGPLGGDPHAQSPHAVREHRPDVDARLGSQLLRDRAEVLGGEAAVRFAEVEERAEELVARHAARAVEIGDAVCRRAHRAPPSSAFVASSLAGGRLMRVAKTAAPNPLSMLTTPIPPAHELSMVSSAETPPKFAP